MSSPSFLDYFAEKIHSYSTKMRGDSLLHCNTSFLMPGNSIYPYDPVRILNDLREYSVGNPHQRTVFINQVLEELGTYQSLGYLHTMERNDIFSSVNNTIFSPYFLNLMNALNSFCFKSIFDKPFMPCSSSITGNMNSFFSKAHMIDLETDSDLKKNCNLPVSDSKMSAVDPGTCSVVPAALKRIDQQNDNKCSMSASVKLNLKLANRKTKQINRRSRNRRRRQKKGINASSASSSSDDDDGNDSVDNLKCPVSRSVSLVVESPSLECIVSFQQATQISPLVSSFVIPVESDSEDDSDWESCDKTNFHDKEKCEVSLSDGVLSSESCSTTSDSSDDSASDDEVKSCGFSFVVPVESSSEDDDDDDWNDNDDEGDWDTCDSSDLPDVAEFEFTGLFVTNLCSFHRVPIVTSCEPETVDSLHVRKEVLDANKKWNELKDVEKKSASKITFAVDEDLVTVFHVEMFDRKGEWEIYATERLRFKRRINELEKVLSWCLDSKHRSNIFKKFIEPDL